MNLINLDFNFDGKDLKIVVPIMATLVSFSIYWFLAQSEKIKSVFFAKNTWDEASRKHIFFTKYMGFLIMGVFPLIFSMFIFSKFDFSYFGISLGWETLPYALLWILGLSLIVIPITYYSARKPKNLLNYPQIRSKTWSRKTFYINLLGWALYLFGYELLFRGTLLFPVYEILGLWPAVAINVALYSATHIPKGMDETIGAVPLGVVLCIVTLQTGTIWVAFFVHLIMAWTNSLTSLKFHPEIQYLHWKKNETRK